MEITLPTQLDFTTGLAIAGFLVALLSLWLTVRRDRAAGKVGVRLTVDMEPGDEETAARLVVRIANSERRTVTVERAGLTRTKAKGKPFAWDLVPPGGGEWWVPPLAVTLDPGDPIYSLKGKMYLIRAAFFDRSPSWVWAENSNGGVDWARIPEPVRAAIHATKRRRPGTDDDYGRPSTVEIEDDVVTEDLAQH